MHSTQNADDAAAGYAAARLFKYHSQFVNPRMVKIVPESRITAHVFYRKHKTTFDSAARFFSEYSMDIGKYMKFAAAELRLCYEDIDSKLMSRNSLNKFAEKLAECENQSRIYEWYSRTVSELASSCLESECASTADFIRKLIRDRKLAAWVVAGKISAYYLAAIPGFPRIIGRLDEISRNELSYLVSRYDMYNTAVNKAVLVFRKRKANPIRDTDEAIEKLRAETKSKDVLFDPSLDS